MAETQGALIPHDTSPEIAERQFGMLMAIPPESRVRMAASMFTSARRIQFSELAREGVPRELWPGMVFRKTYAPDFSVERLERIAGQIDRFHLEHPDLRNAT